MFPTRKNSPEQRQSLLKDYRETTVVATDRELGKREPIEVTAQFRPELKAQLDVRER